MADTPVICLGCGARLEAKNDTLEQDMTAAVACHELYNTLASYTLSLHDDYFLHQLIVDTYMAQHIGKQTKPIAITFALVGLFLVNEQGYTGKQVQNAHIALAKKSKVWPTFSVPESKEWLTVIDVMQCVDEKKQEKIHEWSASVWEIWKPEKEKIATLLKDFLSM